MSLLKEWLVEHKFKDWKRTESDGREVTPALKKRRATSIPQKLSDPAKWHSHSRGISMDVLRRDINLRIEDFGSNRILSKRVAVYSKLMRDYMGRMGYPAALHRRGEYVAVR